ncbi:MAG TPA: MFS transporter [Nocardioides sp.]
MTRTIAVFLGSYGLSVLGNAVAAVVLPLVVLQTTGSAADAGLVAAATAVPAVLAGLVMGGVVDRFHRRTVSVVTDLISAAAIAALPLVDLLTGLSLGWFVLLGIIGSFGDVPGLTAREALLPAVARHGGGDLDRLVALREMTGSVTMLVGPAAAAGLVVLLDGSAALWITAATSALAALTTLLLPREVGRITGVRPGGSPRAALAHLREGWVVLARSPFLLSVTALNLGLVTVLTAVQGLLLPVHFTVEGATGQLGLVLSALALGLLLGSAVYAAWGPRLARRAWTVLGLVGSVGGVALICLLPAVWVVLLGAMVLGVTAGVATTVVGVLMVERIPDAARGRVMGTQNAAITAAPSLGVLGAGILVDSTSLSTTGLVVLGFWALVVVAALVARPLRDLGPAGPGEVLQ